MKTFELTPTNGRKSFYGKAKVIETPEGHKYLDSYNTRVASISNDGTITLSRNKEHFTATTCTHIRSFLELYGYPSMTKQEMLNLNN